MHIDKGVPLPNARAFDGRNKHRSMYPFREMAVGDSLFFPGDCSTVLQSKPYMAAVSISKRDGTPRFAGRKVDEDGVRGVRIWRVE